VQSKLSADLGGFICRRDQGLLFIFEDALPARGAV
jgi:hypothetical protein